MFVPIVTEETSTPNKTCRRCRKNDERPIGTNITIEWDDVKPESKGNPNVDCNSNEYLLSN